MSADGGDHHPLYSLGAVGRVHIGQASLSASIPPPLIKIRQPASVLMTLAAFSAGGGTGVSHSLDDR